MIWLPKVSRKIHPIHHYNLYEVISHTVNHRTGQYGWHLIWRLTQLLKASQFGSQGGRSNFLMKMKLLSDFPLTSDHVKESYQDILTCYMTAKHSQWVTYCAQQI